MRQLLIIGNGFDLQCNLKSSYHDFFEERFKEVFKINDIDNLEDSKRLVDKIINTFSKTNYSESFYRDDPNIKIDFFQKCFKKQYDKSTRWDFIFLFAQVCLETTKNLQWQDVENIIYNVISIAINPKFETNLKIKKESSEQFYQLIQYISYTGDNSSEAIETELLNELKRFEDVFSTFIANQVKKDDYSFWNSSSHLFNSLTDQSNNVKVDVISFNYSLDLRSSSITI